MQLTAVLSMCTLALIRCLFFCFFLTFCDSFLNECIAERHSGMTLCVRCENVHAALHCEQVGRPVVIDMLPRTHFTFWLFLACVLTFTTAATKLFLD